MKPPTRAALYARVSTTKHGQNVGLQLDELHVVAKQRGWDVVGTYEDSGISGTERSRLVWKLDRLARSVVHICSLAESLAAWGVGLVSVRGANVDSTTPSGRFTLRWPSWRGPLVV